MQKTGFHDFSNKVQEYTSVMSFDQKLEFYQEQTKDSNKPKGNGNTYPDLHIQWRLDDLNQGDEMPRLVSIEPNEDRAFDYWLIHDRTNGATHEIVIKPNELGEYDISELIEYISERVNNERFDW